MGIYLQLQSKETSAATKEHLFFDSIKYFGKQKHYKTVLVLCERFLEIYPTLKTEILKVSRVVRREDYLQSIQHHWYFGIMKWFLRPGFFSHPPSPAWLMYCDEDYDEADITIPTMIETELKDGKQISQDLDNHRRKPELLELRRRIVKLGENNALLATPDRVRADLRPELSGNNAFFTDGGTPDRVRRGLGSDPSAQSRHSPQSDEFVLQ